MMNMRERLLAVFRGEKPDVMPWYADLTHWYSVREQDGTLDKRYRGQEGYVRLHRDLGVGVFLFLEGVWRVDYEGLEKSIRVDGDLLVDEIVTPVGTLRGVLRQTPESRSYAPVERMIKSAEDLRIWRYFVGHRRYEANYGLYTSKDTLWGDQGLPVVFVPGSPLGTLIGVAAGIETVSSLWADAREELEETLEVMARADDELYRIVAESPALIVEMGENLSGELIGGFFRRYCSPYYRCRVEQLHQAGKYVSTHLDGTVAGVLPFLKDTGLDCVEAVTPAPVGDVPVEDLRRLAGSDIIIWGGVPGAMFASPFAWGDMEVHLNKIMDCYLSDGGFVLGSADEIPPDGDIEFVRKIADVLEERSLERHVDG